MKTNYRNLTVSVLNLAVQGALAAMFAIPAVAMAEGDDDVAALTNPTNSLEIGVENTSRSSAKFGEYNGLNKKGVDAIVNFGVSGGDAYGQGSGTMRWGVTGTDLGTTSRELGATVSSQGTWDLGIKYDELQHNITDTYQTPYQGSMGGNNFVLPTGFGTVANTFTSLTAPQKAAFHTVDIDTKRKNTSFSAGYHFNPQWAFKFDFNHLDQSGAKLMGFASDALGGANGERIAILPNPTDYTTDTVNLALNWVGDKRHLTVSYFGSFFKDNYNAVTWTTFAGANVTDSMSTPPSNQFHQFNLTGGYDISSATKLVGGLSYGRNTQNDSFAGTFTTVGALTTVPVLPVNSLNGLVVSTHADLKLTNQTTKDLVLSAGLKYNERDNRTPSNLYRFDDLGTTSQALTGTANQVVFNTPMSHRRTQLELGGDYRLDKRQNLHLGYEYERISRWCNNPVASSALLTSAAAQAYYALGGTGCAQVPENKENKIVLGYRLRANEDVNFNAGYTYSRRKADINSSFYNPMQALSAGFENFGYVAFFDASRKEHQLKAGANWQATEKLELGLNGRYTKDSYDDSTLGVQDGHAASINLDATYAYSENNSVSAYASWQDRERKILSSNLAGSATNASAIQAAENMWTNDLTDRNDTLGIGAKQKGLMGGRLQLAEDVTYSHSTTSYSTALVAPFTLATCTATSNLSCGSLPDIKSELLQFKFTGSYQVSKPGKVVAGYMYQRLKSNDFFFNAYQTGYTPTGVLPTNQQAPNYSVNALFVAYNYTFR
ncbi:MAG: MtrB/PioB family decaheme-associated outer membrane protein [Sulfuricella sp.]